MNTKYKLLFLVMLAGISLPGISQNVGIGTTSPIEKLDVDGNVNINGNIKISSVDGQPGQVLMTNSTGATQWSTLPSPGEQYKHFVSFNGNGTWDVPEGVTKIMIEAWGAGGGGSANGGGSGGGYVRSWFSVTPGTPVTYNVGQGGAGGVIGNGQSGGQTTVNVGGSERIAYGGYGGITLQNNNFFFSTLGGGFYNGGDRQSIGFVGEAGHQNDISYMEKSPGVFLQKLRGGKGGDGANTINTGSRGGFANITSGGAYEGLQSNGAPGRIPGGGGGAGGGPSSSGGNGAEGRVIIWY